MNVAFSKNRIVPILEDEKGYISGFDLISGRHIKIKKSMCIINPSWLNKVFGDKLLQIEICNSLG